MLESYQIAIETTRWLLNQTQLNNLKDLPESVTEDLLEIKDRLNYLFDEKRKDIAPVEVHYWCIPCGCRVVPGTICGKTGGTHAVKS